MKKYATDTYLPAPTASQKKRKKTRRSTLRLKKIIDEDAETDISSCGKVSPSSSFRNQSFESDDTNSRKKNNASLKQKDAIAQKRPPPPTKTVVDKDSSSSPMKTPSVSQADQPPIAIVTSEHPKIAETLSKFIHSKHKKGYSNKTTIIAFLITVGYIVGYLPNMILKCFVYVINVGWDYKIEGTTLMLYNLFIRTYLISSAINPVIYGFMNIQFRKEVMKLPRDIKNYFSAKPPNRRARGARSR